MGKRSKGRASEKPDRDVGATGTETADGAAAGKAADDAERRAAEAREKARRAAELAELAEQAAREAAEAAAALQADEAAGADGGPEAGEPGTPEDDRPEDDRPEDATEGAAEGAAEEEPEAGSEDGAGGSEKKPEKAEEKSEPVVSGAAAKADLAKPAEDAENAGDTEDAGSDSGGEDDSEAADKPRPRLILGKSKPEEGRKRRLPRIRVAAAAGGSRRLVALSVVAVVAAAGVGWLWMKKSAIDATETAGKQAAYAATQAAQSISSYDYRTVDSDMRRATAYATGDFRKQFEAQAQRVRTLAPQQQAMVTGTAVKTAVEEISPDKGTVLVFLNQQTVKNSEKGEPERLPSQFTLRMSMTKVGDRWLVSKVEVL